MKFFNDTSIPTAIFVSRKSMLFTEENCSKMTVYFLVIWMVFDMFKFFLTSMWGPLIPVFFMQDLCSSLIFYLGKTGAHTEAFSVYNMLRYSKKTTCKALHEKILHILVAGGLLKDAYVVVKV